MKTKLQTQVFKSSINQKSKIEYSSVTTCVSHLISRNGYRALWQGLTATIIRNTPANALFFPVNEIVKIKIADYRNIEA